MEEKLMQKVNKIKIKTKIRLMKNTYIGIIFIYRMKIRKKIKVKY